MNIVKLKDIIKPNDPFFNKHLKGKYAWWVHMRYIIPFEHMGVQGYIACEENIEDLFKPPFKAEFRDTYDKEMWRYIDQEATDAANCITIYKSKNNYSPDADITAEEVKMFRTWLATELLKFDQNNKEEQLYNIFDFQQTQVLQYYKNLMYDDVIKVLSSIVGNGTMQLQPVKTLACGCNSATDLSSLYLNSNCDPVAIYRDSIYNKMVAMFSEIDFWLQFNEDFLNEFKKYIDNIISMNLSLSVSDKVNVFADCTCINNPTNTNQDILKKLSIALEYLKSGQTAGHKNYIADALREWSSKLYENMLW